jgi:esterase/lipase superfamily enzyme
VCFGSFPSLLTYLSMSAIRPISDLQFEVANTETGVIQAPEPGPRIMRYELTDFEWAAILRLGLNCSISCGNLRQIAQTHVAPNGCKLFESILTFLFKADISQAPLRRTGSMPVWERLLCRVKPTSSLRFAFLFLFLISAPERITAQEAVPGQINAQEAIRDVFVPNESGGRTKLYQKSYALVIGIDDYQNGWPGLKHAVSDAESVAKALASDGFDVSLKTNLSGPALRDAFVSWFLFAGLQEGARLLVWFAGHGETVPAGTYLIPSDVPNPLNVNDGTRSSIYSRFFHDAFPLSEFSLLMKQATARHVLVIFDACFAGDIFSTMRAGPPIISQATLLPARQFITSGIAGQTVSDDGEFAKFFVRAISGQDRSADANGDGYVTANELGLYLHQVVTDYSRGRQTPAYGPLREGGYDKGDFVFALPSQDGADVGAGQAKDTAIQERVWIFVRDQNNSRLTEDFIREFPDSPYLGIAQAQVKAIRNPEQVIVAKADVEKQPTATSSNRVRAVDVLFGTDRAIDNGRFGSNSATALSVGSASISIPEDHRIGQIEIASSFSVLGLPVYQETVATSKHFSILSQQVAGDSQLDSIVRSRSSDSGDVFIYVHGFNTPFDFALFRAAQLAWDVQFIGTAAAFSWPSQASVSAYLSDQQAAFRSSEYLKDFIKAIRGRYRGRVHIIAQAQGASPVMQAIKDIAQEGLFQSSPIDQVILMSPDVDSELFQSLCALSVKAVNRITVYASANDKALLVASKLSSSLRAGSINSDGSPVVGSCANVIDVSAASDNSTFGLGGTNSSRFVMEDIGRLLREPSQAPNVRSAVVRAVAGPKGEYFRVVN